MLFMKLKKVLVTGSSGTIGTRLCEKLLELGYDVTGIDKVQNKWNSAVGKITIVRDLTKEDSLRDIDKDFSLVIHLAANARVYNLVINPSQAMENIQMLFNVLEFSRKSKIKRFIFASSREVYGKVDKEVLSEQDASLDNCESPYTASKVGGEALVQAYKRCYGIDSITFRFSNVYGMYDESDRIVPLFIRQLKAKKDLIIYGKEKMLDFTYIDDTISGIISAIENFDIVKNDVFNLSNGKGTYILQLAKLLQNHLNTKTRIIIKENRTGEILKYIADTTRARNRLGYDPKVEIEEGIRRSIEWYSKHP